MSLDIAIPIVLALATVAVGYLGIRLTLHPLPTEAQPLRRAQLRYKAAFIALSVLGIVLIAWQTIRSQPHPSVWHRPITESEAKAFVAILKRQRTPPRIRVGCAANDDSSCVLASQLIFQFQEAGWKVETLPAQKLALPRALLGISVFAHGTGIADPSNSHSGLWVLQTPQLRTIGDALGVLGINVDVMADATLPDGIYGIYCGPDPGPGTPYYK